VSEVNEILTLHLWEGEKDRGVDSSVKDQGITTVITDVNENDGSFLSSCPKGGVWNSLQKVTKPFNLSYFSKRLLQIF
jgi:hypothetical protein